MNGYHQSGKFTDISTSARATEGLQLKIDESKARAIGVLVDDIATTLQVYLGEGHDMDSNRLGRNWQVKMERETNFRMGPDDIGKLPICTREGRFVPLSTLVEFHMEDGPVVIERLNMYPMVEISANPAPGVTLKDARALCEKTAQEALGRSMRYQWIEE